jgi:tetratricopeptide (TPR) repeat protein
MDEILQRLRAEVDALYIYKENTYCEASKKNSDMKSLISTVLHQFSALPLNAPGTPVQTKAEAYFLKGRALDAPEEYNEEAEESLSRALRLDPGNANAWAALGHCQWKKGDLESARESFNTSVRQCPTSFALRSLSQLVRLGTLADPKAAHEMSISHAKAAVALSMTDPQNWASLAIAHHQHSTQITQKEEDLKLAQRAFTRAVKAEAEALICGSAGEGKPMQTEGGITVPRSVRDPYLHFNRGQVLSYLEEYDSAVASYRLAGSIDPSLKTGVRSL